MRQHQRGPADGLDDLGHGERLARAGDAEQHLVLFAVADTARQLGDGVFLIPARPVVDRQPKAHASRVPSGSKSRPIGQAKAFPIKDLLAEMLFEACDLPQPPAVPFGAREFRVQIVAHQIDG